MKALRIARWIASCAVVTTASALALYADRLFAQTSAAMHKTRPALATSPVVGADGTLWIIAVNDEGKLFIQQTAKALPTRIERHAQTPVRWQTPRVIDTGEQRVLADGQNRPKLLFLRDGRWLVTYTKPSAKPYTGDVMYQISSDQGQSWTAPGKVHRDEQVITHRFESVTQTADGHVHIAWIDKRDAQASKADGHTYRGAGIYRSVLLPGADRFEPETKLADHTCECCHIAMTATQTGEVALMWRHVFDPNIRDHALSLITGNQQTALQRVTFDNWAVDACPHQGPALTQAMDGSLHAVWFGIRNGQTNVRYARLTDESDEDTSEPLPDEDAEFADIIANSNRVWAVWRRFDGQQWQLAARQGDLSGRMLGKKILSHSPTENDIPRLFTHGQNTWVLWRQKDGVRVIPVGTAEEVKDPSTHAGSQRAPAPGREMTPGAFTEQTWRQWQTKKTRPAVVMFTSSECAHCPGTLKMLRDYRQENRSRWSLRVVQMDEPPHGAHASPDSKSSTAGETHWQFAGPARQLQYGVNPQWRGMTPYVVLLPASGEPQFILGAPTRQQLDLLK